MPDPTQHTTTTQWVASLEKLMGKEKADKYIRDLAAQKPILVESLLPAAERVATGETPIAITYIKYVHIFGQRGAPLDYVRLGKIHGRRPLLHARQQSAPSKCRQSLHRLLSRSRRA